jgi:hypothetical protein
MLACFWGFMDRFRQHCALLVVVGNVLARHRRIKKTFDENLFSFQLSFPSPSDRYRMLSLLQKCMSVCVLRLDDRLGRGLLLSRDNMAPRGRLGRVHSKTESVNSFQFKPCKRYSYTT